MDVALEFEDLNVVDNWYNYSFAPYYKTLTMFHGMLQFDFPLTESLLANLNKKFSEMCAFRGYVATNPQAFKPNAHLAQITKVDEAFKVVESKILAYLQTQGVFEKVVVQVSTADFKYDPVVIGTPVAVKCENFTITKSTYIDTTPLVINQPTYQPTSNPGNVQNTTTAGQIVTPTTVSPAPESTNGSGGLVVGLGLASLLLLLAFRKKDKKDQK